MNLACLCLSVFQEKEGGQDDVVDVNMERSCITVNETKLKVDLTKYSEKHQVGVRSMDCTLGTVIFDWSPVIWKLHACCLLLPMLQLLLPLMLHVLLIPPPAVQL